MIGLFQQTKVCQIYFLIYVNMGECVPADRYNKDIDTNKKEESKPEKSTYTFFSRKFDKSGTEEICSEELSKEQLINGIMEFFSGNNIATTNIRTNLSSKKIDDLGFIYKRSKEIQVNVIELAKSIGIRNFEIQKIQKVYDGKNLPVNFYTKYNGKDLNINYVILPTDSEITKISENYKIKNDGTLVIFEY